MENEVKTSTKWKGKYRTYKELENEWGTWRMTKKFVQWRMKGKKAKFNSKKQNKNKRSICNRRMKNKKKTIGKGQVEI